MARPVQTKCAGAAGLVAEKELDVGVCAAGLRKVARAGVADEGRAAHGEAAAGHLDESAARGVAKGKVLRYLRCGDGRRPASVAVGVGVGGRHGPAAPVRRHRPVVGRRKRPGDIRPRRRRR